MNALVERKGLARTSNTPGRTRARSTSSRQAPTARSSTFGDLPGLRLRSAQKEREEGWGPMMEGYLLRRAHAPRLVLLVDIRRGVRGRRRARGVLGPDEEAARRRRDESRQAPQVPKQARARQAPRRDAGADRRLLVGDRSGSRRAWSAILARRAREAALRAERDERLGLDLAALVELEAQALQHRREHDVPSISAKWLPMQTRAPRRTACTRARELLLVVHGEPVEAETHRLRERIRPAMDAEDVESTTLAFGQAARRRA